MKFNWTMAANNPTDTAGAPVASITYRDLFLDSTNDPYAGNCAGIMGRFTTTLQPLAGASHGALLRSRIFATAERELQAYLIATHVQGQGPVVQVLHRPSVRHAPLNSLDGDEMFGFMGDTRHGRPPMLVHWGQGPDKLGDRPVRYRDRHRAARRPGPRRPGSVPRCPSKGRDRHHPPIHILAAQVRADRPRPTAHPPPGVGRTWGGDPQRAHDGDRGPPPHPHLAEVHAHQVGYHGRPGEPS
jgi:hypothetical protein